MYKVYELQRDISRSTMQITSGTFITFSSIGFGSAYATGRPIYATTDKAIQSTIEESKHFKNGRIKLIKSDSAEDTGAAAKAQAEAQAKLDAEAEAKTQAEAQAKLDAEAAAKAQAEAQAKLDAEAAAKAQAEAQAKLDAEAAANAGGGDAPQPDGGSPESRVHPEVTNWQEARTVLRTVYGVAHQGLTTEDRIRTRAAELGVSFPNAV